MPNKSTLISMTGYGRGTASGKKFRANVEIRAVNSRFLEIRSKLPRPLSFLEPIVREGIEQVITRGVVDFMLQLTPVDPAQAIPLDESVASAYVEKAKKFAKDWNCPDGLTAVAVLKLPGVLGAEGVSIYENEKEIPLLVKTALTEALAGLLEMRKREGEKLQKVLQRELADFRENLHWVEKNTAELNKRYSEKLRTRISDWSKKNSVEVDEGRLMQEITYYLDRSDVTEELDRLESHLRQTDDALMGSGKRSSGKRLEFLAQEMGREVNTIGAKSDQTDLSHRVVEMKLILEKIREQVQNLE